MFNEQTAQPNPYLRALKDHLPVAMRVFVVILLLCGAGAFLTRQYSASAVLALNPQVMQNRDGQGQSTMEVAWSALTDQQIAAIISRFQLDKGITRLRAQGQVFTYVRSNIFLNVAEMAGSGSREVVVSYTGESPSNAMGVANAIAQDMSQAKAPAQQSAPAATVPGDALEKSSAQLKMLSQSQGQDTAALQAQEQQRLKKDEEFKAARSDTAAKLAALEQERAQLNAAPQSPAAQPAPAPNPARAALEQQITAAQNHLASLRQRYTELYPNVQEAEDTLATLEARLSHIPPDRPRAAAPKPAPDTAGLNAIAMQENQLRALASDLDDEIQSTQEAAEVLRQRIAGAKSAAQEYTAEQQRYNALLQVQEALDEGESDAGNGSISGQTPLFMIVKSATSADPLGVAFNPLFWISSLILALLAASFSVYLAEQFAPAIHERAPSRSFHPS